MASNEANLREGWLARQFARVEQDVSQWPPAMKREAGFDGGGMPADVAERVVSLFASGESINHIVFLLDYRYCIDQVSAAVRARLRESVAPDDCSCRFSGDQADASDCARHGNARALDGVFDHKPGCRAPDYQECTCAIVAPAAAVECAWHRPGLISGGVRICRTCVAPITECGCSNFGRTPKARCELCHGSGWVAKGEAQ